jgi:glucose/arabinose dehydrogenase
MNHDRMGVRRCVLAAAAFSLSAMSATDARADFAYSNFASVAGISMVGNAQQAGNVLRVTPAVSFQAGAAWHQIKQNVGEGFRTSFTFRLTGISGGGADGFAMVIQNSALTALGGNGCRNGYDGIANSIAIEFDTWQSESCEPGFVNDPNDNHVSIHTRGTLPNSAVESASLGISTAIPNMSDGAIHAVVVEYDGSVMSVYIDNVSTPVLTVAVDLSSTLALDGQSAWIGFTGGTGGGYENHDILSWSFTEESGSSGPPYRPNAPIITEPSVDGKVVSAADVHMETGPFSDLDGDEHLCTDWEIWKVNANELVWAATCKTNEALKVHIHLADGQFLGSSAATKALLASTDYRLRVRYRDDSGDAETEYSLWSQRLFRTGDPSQIFGLLIKDVEVPPAVKWVLDSGNNVELPSGATQPSLTLGSAAGQNVLVIRGQAMAGNEVIDSAALSAHVLARVRVNGGSTGISMGRSILTVLGDDCQKISIYLPAVTCPANDSRYYWVSTNGSTYVGTSQQTAPVFTTLARGTIVPWTPMAPNLEVERFATGFQLPVGIAMVAGEVEADEPFMYVAELYGAVKVVRKNGTVSTFASGLLNFNPTGDFPGSGEMGLASICRDHATGNLYGTILYANNGNTNQLYPRIIRLTTTDGLTASAVQTVLEMPGETMSASHQISSITIGPDGKLYVHVGDGFNPSVVQNLAFFRGKILRMELNGQPCTDNPFYNAGDGITARDYVFTYGHRNPFGGAWRVSDQRLFVVENGPSVDRFFNAQRGTNYMWNGSDGSMYNGALHVWVPSRAPVTLAVLEPGTFNGSGFGSEWMGSIIVTESGPTWAQGPQQNGKRLVRFDVSPAGALTAGPTSLVEYTGSGRGTAAAIAAGPDGIYFSDLYKDLDYQTPIDPGASIFRVRYRAPADCNANGTDDRCDINRGISLDANGNLVPDECECPADIDGTGFVDTNDFDAFVLLFESGSQDADFDGTGFVDTDDFDAFVRAFEAGC